MTAAEPGEVGAHFERPLMPQCDRADWAVAGILAPWMG
jgi:hypothetical protein